MRILIATGIYPPEVGGPARFAAEFEAAWRASGDEVSVFVASRFNHLPGLIRPIVRTFSILRAARRADAILALDTLSAAVPAYLAAQLWRKPLIIRIGGDAAWEAYVERTKREVTLSQFCRSLPADMSGKERRMVAVVRKVFRSATRLVFSTAWYAPLAAAAYGPFAAFSVIENPDGPRRQGEAPAGKTFLHAGRPIFLKNADRFKRALATVATRVPGLEYVGGSMPRDEYVEKLKHCYAVAVPSLSEVSPNTAIDAIRHGKPLILTRECGYAGRFGDAAIVVDPTDEAAIGAAIERLCEPEAYAAACAAAEAAPCQRTFADVAREFRSTIEEVCASL